MISAPTDGPPPPRSASTDVRLAELMAALSLATDLGMGQPLEFALCSCVLALRIGDALGLTESELRNVYYQALLRYIGCNAETSTLASIVGDELTLRGEYATVDPGHPTEVIALLIRSIRQANADTSPLQIALLVARGLVTAPRLRGTFAGHCEVAQRLAERFGFPATSIAALGQLYERWDGKGLPRGLRGEEVALPVRIVTLAQDAVTFHRLGGEPAATNVARERRGTAYDPRIVDLFCERTELLMRGLDSEPAWETVLSLEPGPRHYLTASELDNACEAMADFADLKSPFTLNHSRGVAAIAAEAGRRCHLPAGDISVLYRAGLLHDLGRIGVSTAIWDKPTALTEREWERVRLHPYYTERILARSPALVRLGAVAALHHERLDGTGYHRGVTAAALSPAARILATADVYHALTEPRPHRSARPPDDAATELRRQVRLGQLDGEAAHAVLEAAGHRLPPRRRDLVAGLSPREIEVLRLLARGNSTKQVANRLFVAEKTVDNHIQHIYAKIGVSTRAGATLFAMEHELIAEAE